MESRDRPGGAIQGDGHQPARLLVVEDDDILRESVESALVELGYDVRSESDAASIDDVLAEFDPDLALIDIGLPSGDTGFDLARTIAAGSRAAVVFMTARGEIPDRIRGFDLGADDYVVKPFSMVELTARVRAVLRRTGPAGSSIRSVRDIVLDPGSRTVTRGGHRVDLRPTEFDVLNALMSRPGQSRTKRELLAEVWGFEDHAPHLVEVQVSNLRRKLEKFGDRIVLTCRDGSYMVPD